MFFDFYSYITIAIISVKMEGGLVMIRDNGFMEDLIKQLEVKAHLRFLFCEHIRR